MSAIAPGTTATYRPTQAFVTASWAALLIAAFAFLIGLWRAEMMLNEKGYYFAIFVYGLFSAVSVQKVLRDRLEGIRVTSIYYLLSWIALGLSIFLLVVGLWQADLASSEKGFYAMSFLFALFAAVAVQKNVRDIEAANATDEA